MVACICHLIFFCHNTIFFEKILCCGNFVTTHYFFKKYCVVAGKIRWQIHATIWLRITQTSIYNTVALIHALLQRVLRQKLSTDDAVYYIQFTVWHLTVVVTYTVYTVLSFSVVCKCFITATFGACSLPSCLTLFW